MSKRVFNFNPGPATLPLSVLQEASKGLLEINGSGMSVLEVSHRSKDYEAIQFGARDRLLKLMGLDPNEYTALFLGGGASLQFAMLPMNFLGQGKSADYVHTGEWSIKAIKEAKRFGTVNTAGSSEDQKFSYIPKKWNFNSSSAYAHITTNNTIEGTEWFDLPDTGSVPLIADASSDILALNRDYRRFTMIYAGAQKNLGPAGVTVVVAKKSWVESAFDETPAILSYKTFLKNDSLYNTPPAFAVYVLGLTLAWVEEQGGVKSMESRNREKAGLIYSAVDEFPDFYEAAVSRKEDRSLMNITFRLKDASKEKDFLAGAQSKNLEGLKGHRSVGGFRASVYNAFPMEGAAELGKFMREFARR